MNRVAEDVKRAKEWLDDQEMDESPTMLAILIGEVRAETLEAAAKLAERDPCEAANVIADNIRAMKDQPPAAPRCPAVNAAGEQCQKSPAPHDMHYGPLDKNGTLTWWVNRKEQT